MSLREEFVTLATTAGVSIAELCRRFGISRKTGYKWIQRYHAGGAGALADQSRRPHASPHRTTTAMEAQVLALRAQQPTWGGRKLRRRLRDLGVAEVPAASTITAILRRYDQLHDTPPPQAAYCRFERAEPNDLWQMDFKGDFALGTGHRCDPLTLLDDHSRYNLCLEAGTGQTRERVQAALTTVFQRYGLPRQMTMDNGGPWGAHAQIGGGYTRLQVWLLKLGIRVSYSRPYHPQTQGKLERFHRSLKADVLQLRTLHDLVTCQASFDQYRQLYNHVRPHAALADATPATRYRASPRPFPTQLPEPTYPADAIVLKVRSQGSVYYARREYFVGKAFQGEYIAVNPRTDEALDFYFGSHCIKRWARKV